MNRLPRRKPGNRSCIAVEIDVVPTILPRKCGRRQAYGGQAGTGHLAGRRQPAQCRSTIHADVRLTRIAPDVRRKRSVSPRRWLVDARQVSLAGSTISIAGPAATSHVSSTIPPPCRTSATPRSDFCRRSTCSGRPCVPKHSDDRPPVPACSSVDRAGQPAVHLARHDHAAPGHPVIGVPSTHVLPDQRLPPDELNSYTGP